MTKPKRLTIGMRAKIKAVKKTKEGYDGRWGAEYPNRHVLLQERSSGGDFSVMLIGKEFENERILPKETTGVIENQMAWVHSSELEFVNADFDVNLDYMDWYQEHENDFCGDCLAWHPKRGIRNPETGKDYRCPNPECPGGRWDNGECPDCGTKLTGKHEDYCKKCKVHMEEMRI